MNPQEVTVFNRKRAKLFRDGTEPVYVLDDGRFVVKRNGDWMAFKTLATLDKTKAKQNNDPVVKLMRFYDDDVSIKEVIDWLPKKMVHADGNVTRYPGSGWRLYDEKAVHFHKKMCEKISALRAQIDKLTNDFEDTLGDTIGSDNFREVQLTFVEKGQS